MGELLGLGVSHYPPFAGRDEDMARILRGRIADPGVPAAVKDPATWPALMREEWGGDEGAAGAKRHLASMLRGMRKVREAVVLRSSLIPTAAARPD